MLKVLARLRGCGLSLDLLTAFRKRSEGNIATIFAIVLVPLAGIAGFALDFGRAQLVTSKLQQSVDAAVISAGARMALSEEDLTSEARRFFRASGGEDVAAENIQLALVKGSDNLSLTVTADVPTTLLNVIGYSELRVSVDAVAKFASEDLEVAIVLDNTGSMAPFIGDLKTGATDLVNRLFDTAANVGRDVKVALVPYVGAVNIGNEAGHIGWMDVTADAQYHGMAFEGSWTLFEGGCTYTPDGGGGDSGPGSGGDGGDRSEITPLSPFPTLARVLQEVIGIGSAHAQTAPVPSTPSGYAHTGVTAGEECWGMEPTHVNHFDLFNQLNVAWKGCVEARPEPFDVDDTPPDSGNPDTLFVPYFWPDEPDTTDFGTYPNNYLADGEASLPAPWIYSWEGGRARATFKYYLGNTATIDDVPPLTLGPNQACPDPVVPLTDSRSALLSAISGMSEWEGSGTVASEGLAWGWRVLSPTEPFTEGAAYGEANKVIVLMTDGKNWAAEQNPDVNFTDYTAYGYLQYNWRIFPQTYSNYKDYLDSRLLQACTNAKAAGVTIYTITFGVLDAETQQLYENCASKPPYHYDADTTAELVSAFNQIAGELTALRIAQ
ncbi:MAG: pilus assembly protein [Hyphomicrobiaceae bacterium]